jgi:hypothetical protein
MNEARQFQYALAGWLAIISAILLIPEIGLGVLVGFMESDLKVVVVLIPIANLIIGVYILYTFRRLLNQEFNFHSTDAIVTILILLNILSFILGVIELGYGMFVMDWGRNYDLTVVTSVLVFYSIIAIVFAVMLLKMKEDLYGLLRPYAYVTITSGVCGSTVVLSPFGLLAAIVALVIQGMIFLRAEREAQIL